MRKTFNFLLAVLAVVSFIVCVNSSAEATGADLVVYSKIFTSKSNQILEAFAAKDGKYVYLGDNKGAEAFAPLFKNGQIIRLEQFNFRFGLLLD